MTASAVRARRSPVVDLDGDPWAALAVRSPERLRAALASTDVEQLVQRGAPRDLALAERFLQRHLPAGKWLIHGAGTHTRALLPLLRSLPGVELVGVIDKLASTFAELDGLPVMELDEAAHALERGEAERVLLSNTIWEMSMRSALIDAGIATERIHAIYSDPRYVRASIKAHDERVAALPANGCEFALVDFERQGQQVIDDGTLATILPPERTLRLDSERFETLSSTSVFRTVGFAGSTLLLLAMLQRLRPRAIYLRTFIEDNWVASLLARALPGTRLVHELYDVAVTIEPSFLQRVHGHDERSLQMAMAGELFSVREADWIVTKRGGSAWSSVAREFVAPHASFFPQVHARPARRPRKSSTRRLVYAGNLPSPNTLAHDMVGALFPLFEHLSATTDVSISVFNGAHRSRDLDATYAPYCASACAKLHYHRALPYARLVAELERHDYGWMYFPRDGIDFADERVLISNKLTGYLCAGLPVLVDDGWEFMAELVREFEAGIVLPMRAPEQVAPALADADLLRHRAGALALRDHMLASNAQALERLRSVILDSGEVER